MIIVSQNKKTIINFGRITEILVNENEVVITDDIYKDYGETIGVYKTKERAKEVLQEIIKCYKDTNYEYENCWCVRNLIYEMPEE